MDKYRLVEEKFIGAQGFIDDVKDAADVRPKGEMGEFDARCIVRITQQAKPRSCITTAQITVILPKYKFLIRNKIIYFLLLYFPYAVNT